VRLKQLILSGFKSFADKTVIRFDKGVTAIVGPNGCGKSNIVDAVRWVLGEQSAKSMRGAKMNDVLFAGTDKRKAQNFAEVTIVFTDVDDALPIEYEEVAVTRRLFRNGDSEYRINGNLVRLKDIHSLFWDSGLGKSAFSVFEQGKIEQVINLPPLERRVIFEEASGILRFKQNKKEAMRRLAVVDTNAARISDVHGEVKKQLSVLEKQAKVATAYKEKKQRSEILDKELLVSRWNTASKRGSRASEERDNVDNVIVKGNTAFDATEVALKESRDAATAAEDKASAALEDVFAVRSSKEIHVAAIRNEKERLEELTSREKTLEEKIRANDNESEDEKSVAQKASGECSRLKDICEAAENKGRKFAEHSMELEATIAASREKQKEEQRNHYLIVHAEKDITAKVQGNTIRREAVVEGIAKIKERRQDLLDSVKHHSEMSTHHKKQLKQQTQIVEKKKKELDTIKNTIADTVEEFRATEKDLDDMHRKNAMLIARRQVLQHMQEDMEGLSSDTKRIVREAKNKKSPLYNIVSNVYEEVLPKKGYEKAFAAAMRHYAQTLVVATNKDLEKLQAFAADNKIKDFSVICAEHITKNTAKEKAVKGAKLLVDNVSKSKVAEHLLKGVYVVDDVTAILEAKKQNRNATVVTTDGVMCNAHGVIFYAFPRDMTFMREAELNTLKIDIAAAEAVEKKATTVVEKLGKQRAELYLQRDDLDREMRKQEMTLIELNHTLQRTLGDLEGAKGNTAAIDEEGEALAKENTILEASVAELDKKYKETQQQLAASDKALVTIEAETEALFKKYQEHRDEQRGHNEKYKGYTEELHKAKRESVRYEDKDVERKRQKNHDSREIADIRKRYEALAKQKQERERVCHKSEGKIIAAEQLCEKLEAVVENKKTKVKNLEEKREKLREKYKEKEGRKHHLELKIAQHEAVCRALEDEALERYDAPIDAIETQGLVVNAEDAEKELRSLRRALEDAGDVNMTSIEECEHLSSRGEYLSKQLKDLAVSQKDIGKIIGKLERESRKRFNEAFEVIKENFKKNFQILFRGGEADLRFTESNDILDAGIEIVAKPPGKQLRSIGLMSGGEKCLTALALLFAIFEYRPAPFCILDEVDAPLDDANISRFLNVVKHFIDTTQFVIVTHNKNTMTVADALCGVSMEEKGVSKLIPLYLGNTKKEEPAQQQEQQQEPVLAS